MPRKPRNNSAKSGAAQAVVASVPAGESTGQQAAVIAGVPGSLAPNLGGLSYLGGIGGLPFDLGLGVSGQGQWLNALSSDPYAFGRWVGQWYWGTYNTYRLITAHPRIRQARATLTGPILASRWDYEVREGTPEKLVNLVKDQLNALRRRFIEDAIRALDFGWAPFEPIWEVRDGQHWIARVKALLPDVTTIHVDQHGNFTGLTQGVGTIQGGEGMLRPDGYKALIYTFDRECGNLYGRPLAENCRQTGWRMWLDASLQTHMIGEKLSQVIAMGFAPAGSYSDGKGGTVTPVDEMRKAMQGIKDTGMAVFANLISMAKASHTVEDLQKAAASAMSSLEFYDAGNHSAAIEGELSRMRHAEDLMFAGYLLSSRTGMQSEHGSRADSDRHSDTGLISSELIDGDIVEQGAQPLADWILELNGGPQFIGAVRVKPAGLVDRSREGAGLALETLGKDPDVAEAMVQVIDEAKLFQSLDIPVLEGASLKTALAAVKQRKQAAADKAAEQKTQQVQVMRRPGSGKNGLSTMLSRWVGGEGMEPATKSEA